MNSHVAFPEYNSDDNVYDLYAVIVSLLTLEPSWHNERWSLYVYHQEPGLMAHVR